MSDPADVPESQRHFAWVIAGWPCVECGYDLRGQPVTGVCPECGTAISRSLRGPFLTQCGPEWLRAISRGFAAVAFVGLIECVRCAAYLLGNSGLIPYTIMSFTLSYPVRVLVILLNVLATWVVTAPPVDATGKRLASMAKSLRRIAVILALLEYLLVGAMFRRTTWDTAMFAICLTLFGMVFDVLFFGYAAQLSAWLPDRRLRDQFYFCRIAIPITVAGSYLLEWVLLMFGRRFLMNLFSYTLPGFVAVTVVGLYYSICAAVLSVKLRQVARRATTAAIALP